ncbi:hypothetical protein QYF36_016170 [Acer negundo]|nr:hypothetical protein QYF36_016170 [Acer negundo]
MCSVVVSSSTIFSPSSSLFCNKTSILSSPETLTLSLAHAKFPSSSSSSLSSPTTAQSSSSPSSLLFGFVSRNHPLGSLLLLHCLLRITGSGSGSGSPQMILKRKIPEKLDILVAAMSFAGVAMTQREIRRDELEEEREGSYSVYCKRGRREAMEDRFSTVVQFSWRPKTGAKAAEFAAENLDKNILEDVVRRVDDDSDHEI